MNFSIEGVPEKDRGRVIRSVMMWSAAPYVVGWAGFWAFWIVVAWRC